MTDGQMKVLRHLWIWRYEGWKSLPSAIQRSAGSLVRLGLVEKRRQGEYFRGEGRNYWMEYQLTSEGRDRMSIENIK
jgi:predicted transcriptional regulator